MASLSSFMKNDACLVRLQFSSFMSFVIGDQLFGSRIFAKNTVLFLIGKVAGNGQYLSVKNTLVSIDGFAVLEKSLEFSVNDDRKRVAQTDQLLIWKQISAVALARSTSLPGMELIWCSSK